MPKDVGEWVGGVLFVLMVVGGIILILGLASEGAFAPAPGDGFGAPEHGQEAIDW